MKRLVLIACFVSGCVRDVVLGSVFAPPAAVADDDGMMPMQMPQPMAACAPEVERCNGVDDSCEGVVDEGCDDDTDGACDVALVVEAGASCVPGDCRDDGANAALLSPLLSEVCDDGVDNDCNGSFDEQEGQCTLLSRTLLQPRVQPAIFPHRSVAVLELVFAPTDAGERARAWRVTGVNGNPACVPEDLVEHAAAHTPGTVLFYLRLDPAIVDRAARIGCVYSVALSLDGEDVARVDVVPANSAPDSVVVSPAQANGTGFDVLLTTDGGSLVANALDADGDTLVFHWQDDAISPVFGAADPELDTLVLGAMPPGTYVLTLEVKDSVSATVQRSVPVTLHVHACVWATVGGAGAQDGSAPTQAFATVTAALNAAALSPDTDACIAGGGTFSEDLSLPTAAGAPGILGGFDVSGLASLDHPHIVMLTSPLQTAAGYHGTIKSVTLSAPGLARVVTLANAALVLDDVDVEVPNTNDAIGVDVIGTTQATDLRLRSSRIFSTAGGGSGTTLVQIDAAGAPTSLFAAKVQATLFPCTGSCRVMRTIGPVTATVLALNLEADSTGDVTVFDVGAATPNAALAVRECTSWSVSGGLRATGIHAAAGVDLHLERNGGLAVQAAGDAYVVDLGGGAIVIADNASLGASTAAGEAVAIDLRSVSDTRISGNQAISATATSAFGGVANDAVAIRLAQTTSVQIRDNTSIYVLVAGTRSGIGVLDGAIDRSGARVPGASVDLQIVSNQQIQGGDGTLATATDCGGDPAPETTDISAGIVLVGSVRPSIRDNGRPARVDGGISGGKTRPYWNAATRRIEPVVAGVWLVDCVGAALQGNELRGGALPVLSDVACVTQSPMPTVRAFLDGLPENGAALAEAGSLGTVIDGNGIDCAPDEACVAVWLAATSDTRIQNNVLAASATTLVSERSTRTIVLHNLLALDGGGTFVATRGVSDLSFVANIVRSASATTLLSDVSALVRLWGNLLDGPGAWPPLGFAAHNATGDSALVEYGAVWLRALTRLSARSRALDLAPASDILPPQDIDGEARDMLPDAGPDELHRSLR